MSVKTVILVAVVILLLVLLAVSAAAVYMCAAAFGKRPPAERGHYTYMYDHYAGQYPRREVVFSGKEGELHGFVYGEENSRALVVVCHGIGAFHEDYLSSIIWFVDHGYRVFAPDFTGSGSSGGKGTVGLPQSAIDLDCVLSFIEADTDLCRMPKVLFGHSWGAYAVGAVLNFEHNVKAAVTVAGFNDPVEQIEEIFLMMMGKAGRLVKPALWIYHRLRFGKNGVLRAVDGINKSGIPVLIIQGAEDRLNAPDGTSIYAAADKITNPNAVCHLITKKHCADHMSPFFTDEANEELCHMAEILTEIGKKYTGKEKEEKEREYYESLDKGKNSKPNEALYAMVNEFYKKAIGEAL